MANSQYERSFQSFSMIMLQSSKLDSGQRSQSSYLTSELSDVFPTGTPFYIRILKISKHDMGLMISKLKHPFRDFNVESRAHKVISQATPKLAPRHAKDEIDIQRMKKAYPEVFEESLRKNEVLDNHLKDVYVKSTDNPINPAQKIDPTKALPQDRRQPDAFLFGHKEPDMIPVGKATLRHTLKFISQHQSEPQVYTTMRIAEEHKLSEDLVKKILKYYKVFEIYMPLEKGKTKAKFAGPSNPKVYVIRDERKLIASPEKKSDKDKT